MHGHDANLLAKVTDSLAQHDFANHAAAVTTNFSLLFTMFTFEAPLPIQALQALCDVDTNNHQEGNFLSATNDKIFEGTSSNELIKGRRRGLTRNCG